MSNSGDWNAAVSEWEKKNAPFLVLGSRRITDGVKGPVASALDTQEGGDHYKQMKIQPVEYITANGLDYLQGNVVKYVSRHKLKNGAEDVRKAIHYLQLILQIDYGEKA